MEVTFLVEDFCDRVLVLDGDRLVFDLATGSERLDLDIVVSAQIVLLYDDF